MGTQFIIYREFRPLLRHLLIYAEHKTEIINHSWKLYPTNIHFIP